MVLFLTLVDNARVELDNDGVANDVAEEAGGVLALALRAVFHGEFVMSGESLAGGCRVFNVELVINNVIVS